jgi:hypothetical protein
MANQVRQDYVRHSQIPRLRSYRLVLSNRVTWYGVLSNQIGQERSCYWIDSRQLCAVCRRNRYFGGFVSAQDQRTTHET